MRFVFSGPPKSVKRERFTPRNLGGCWQPSCYLAQKGDRCHCYCCIQLQVHTCRLGEETSTAACCCGHRFCLPLRLDRFTSALCSARPPTGISLLVWYGRDRPSPHLAYHTNGRAHLLRYRPLAGVPGAHHRLLSDTVHAVHTTTQLAYYCCNRGCSYSSFEAIF